MEFVDSGTKRTTGFLPATDIPHVPESGRCSGYLRLRLLMRHRVGVSITRSISYWAPSSHFSTRGRIRPSGLEAKKMKAHLMFRDKDNSSLCVGVMGKRSEGIHVAVDIDFIPMIRVTNIS